METFPTQEALFDAAALGLTTALAAGIEARGHAGAVLTGGSTPGAVYDRLAKVDLDWRKIDLTLSDERFVDTTNDESNEKLIRSRLLNGPVQQASFVGLKYPSPDVETGARAAEGAVAGLLPVDVTLLGMGRDGHIASLFPGDPICAYALDPAAGRLTVGVPMSGLAPFVPRISLTLRALLETRLVLLLITGEAKRSLVQRVFDEPTFDPPVAALLRQPHVPVRVLWAP